MVSKARIRLLEQILDLTEYNLMTTENPFDWGENSTAGDLLETNPAAAYYSYANDWQGGPRQEQYYQNQFQNIYNQYLGSLGGQLRQGNIPSTAQGENTWAGYLQNYDWTDRYTSMPPQMRGDFQSMFNPRTRQIYF